MQHLLEEISGDKRKQKENEVEIKKEDFFKRSPNLKGYQNDDKERFRKDQFAYEGQVDYPTSDESPTPVQRSPTPIYQREQPTRIPHSSLPRRAADARKRELPTIPRHGFSQTRFAPESKFLPQKRQCQPSPRDYKASNQEYMQFDESIPIKRKTIKGIVKPNLMRKDLMKLRDLNVRPRGAQKQTSR